MSVAERILPLKHKLLTGKRLALSGILIEQADSVIDAFSEWIDLRLCAEKEGWVILDGTL
jgi:ribosomal protein L11 methyltransferase